jgi:23S rRNA pseudouridine1911/1915/1917 synthase
VSAGRAHGLLRVDTASAGQTVAQLIRAELEGVSWNRARELCRRGKIKLNGAVQTDPARRVALGDQLEIDLQAPRLRPHGLPDSAIVYVDPQLVVVSKPAGLLSVPFDPGDRDTLVDRLSVWLRHTHPDHVTELGVVQRLDKDTTGLLVFARTLTAKRHLQQQFRAHSIERSYLALVHGELKTPLTVDTHLLRNRGDGLRGSYAHFRKPRGPLPADAQRAITHVRPIRRLRGATLIECRLHTGRQHQIRIHLSEQRHPLIGEAVYIRDYAAERIAAPRPMLHAAVLGFSHPSGERPLRFELPPPDDFSALCSRLAFNGV